MSERQTPFFLFDLGRIRSRFERISAAFPGAGIFYAVKANNHEEVLAELAAAGSCFDVGARHEAELLLSLGVEPERMIFSAPVKLQSHIRDAYRMGIDMYVFDSEEELSKLALLAPGSKVFLRLAVGNEGSFFPLSMKFGAPPSEACALMSRASELGLSPYGIAFHVGSQCTRVETWREAMEVAAGVAWELHAIGIDCRALDIGGGFPIRYTEDVPSIEEVASSVLEIHRERFPVGTRLLVEPGRFVVGESAILATTVIGRALRGDEEWLFVDVSAFHGLLEAQQMNGRFPYPVRASHNGTASRRYVLSGPTCDPDDTIMAEVWLPEVKVGERLYIQNVGAYSFVYATSFHGFSPPEIHMLSDGGSLEAYWGEEPADGFVPEYGEEKRHEVEHDGQVARTYFRIKDIPHRWLEPLWRCYHQSMHYSEAVQEQSCYDRESFIGVLRDPDYEKVLLTVDDRPAGMLIATGNMEKAKAAYINPAFIENRFPREVAEGNFLYITALFISGELRNIGFVRQMFVAITDGIRDKGWIFGGDVTDSKLFVPKMIERISAEEGYALKSHLLGTQSYFAFTGPDHEWRGSEPAGDALVDRAR